MTKASAALLAEALKLPVSERGALAARLIESLDDSDAAEELTPEEWDAAWSAELSKRLEDLESGKAKTVPWETVLEELRSRRGRTD